ncbi:ATP-binding protein [Streptomyces sp. NBC_01565]|uniref:ATP-binding protein n=1 Tax=unclassified Streptomyces TaxID=2593676 RepID=UPI00224F9B34|nr:ATP-binding protein [Streptomyces sp. NBC_01565]MCX4546018.1 ATP-binding protein [Streptomyces sp. NBC_01565]
MTTTSAERTALRPLPAVAGARQAARAFLEALRRPAIGRERADTVVLVVSELVTNALRHGDGTGRFGWHMVNDHSLATVVTPGPGGGKTVRALLPR